MYAADKTGFYGDLASVTAWRASLGPAALFGFIVGVSLMLALWQGRRESELVLEPEHSHRDPITPNMPIEEVPRV